jgi:CheY-like chemotaxis protein
MIYRVLVVDDDPWMRQVTATLLNNLPLEIDFATDGTIALAKAVATRPDLIISDVHMRGMDGWSLVRRLRGHAELAFVPFIFLTSLPSAAEVLRGFRLGADDFLSKPFDGAELERRVLAVLESRSRIEASARRTLVEGPGVHGGLHEVGLSPLLVLLDMERKTGLLSLSRDQPAERCQLFLREGRVIAASSDADGGLVDAAAVFHALNWPEGTFSFTSVEVVMADRIEMSTTHLLMEGAQRLDDALQSARRVAS